MRMNIKQILKNLGFNDIEFEIYSFLLEAGGSSFDRLSEKLEDTSRLKIQSILHQLLSKNYIQSQKINDEDHYFAESPDSLIRILEKEIEQKEFNLKQLKKQKGELDGIVSNERPVVRYYEGKRGLFKMLEEFNNAKHEQSPLLVFDPSEVNELFTDEEKKAQKEARTKKEIFTKAIYCNDTGVKENNILSEMRRVDKKEYIFQSDITIFDNKVMIASLSDTVIGIVIEDDKISTTFRSLFELAYKQASEE